MDFHDPELMDDDYPYSDYYSTGGKYRPPKTPRNHGWIAAALGALLLCVTGGAVLLRSQGSGSQAPQPSPSVAYEEVSAGNGAAAAEQPQGETAEAPVLNGEAVLSISKDPGEELSFQEIYKKVIPIQ